MSLDWLIIGGGIHGVHIAARLLGEAGVLPERLRIVDPAHRLLARWRAHTATTGMTHLRSAAVHHLDLKPSSMHDFAGQARHRRHGLFASPYDRPALDLFNAHCDKVVATFGIADLHIRDRAVECGVSCEGATIRLASGREIASHTLVLALGAGEQPFWPQWAPLGDARVSHVFEPGFSGWPTSRETVAVVGGGISAAQVALRLVDEGHRVHVVSRHALREHQFDSDPGWLGPKFMASYSRERDVDRRRTLIARARNRGSVPKDVRRVVRRAIDRDRLDWHGDAVAAVDVRDSCLDLRLSQETVTVDRVLLATGFATHRPGGDMVDRLVASASLPCARCGYPIVDSALRWHPRVHVSGPLAELELGPVARNIAGARRSGDRLVEVARAAR